MTQTLVGPEITSTVCSVVNILIYCVKVFHRPTKNSIIISYRTVFNGKVIYVFEKGKRIASVGKETSILQ